MILHKPFMISARLLPALKIGDAWLSLESIVARDERGRQRAIFILDLPDGASHRDDNLRSGCGGFLSPVEAFGAFLGYLDAFAEAVEFETRSPFKSENSDLFPSFMQEWAVDNHYEISFASLELIADPELNSAAVNHDLIEDYMGYI